MLLSVVQQSEVAVHISSLWGSFPISAITENEQSSPCYTIGPHWLPVSYRVVCICLYRSICPSNKLENALKGKKAHTITFLFSSLPFTPDHNPWNPDYFDSPNSQFLTSQPLPRQGLRPWILLYLTLVYRTSSSLFESFQCIFSHPFIFNIFVLLFNILIFTDNLQMDFLNKIWFSAFW